MPNSKPLKQFSDHATSFEDNAYAYPVVSRRSGGISLGVNLNPDKACNFDCIYCQVDRHVPAAVQKVDEQILLKELEGLLTAYRSGTLFEHPKFHDLPEKWRGLNSIAFAGDGEPTSYRRFPEIIQAVIQLKQAAGLPDVPLILISNATLFEREAVKQGLQLITDDAGEIWAKLDAGTQDYYQQVDRTVVSLDKVLKNITELARQTPLVIQSLFMNINGQAPASEEIDAYCQRLNDIISAGGKIKLVQIYTVARMPAEACVTSLGNHEVDQIAETVREKTGLQVESYYGN